MTKIHAALISALISGFPGNSEAQQDSSFIPPPINPLNQSSPWSPSRAKPGSPAVAQTPRSVNPGSPARAGSGSSAASRKPTAAPTRKHREVFTPGLSDAEIRRWLNILIRRAEGAPWVKRFRQEHSRRPVIKISEFSNRTSAHINTPLVHRVARSLISASHKLKPASKAQAADFLLMGHMVAIDQVEDRTTLKSTLLALSLINVTTAEKVWLDMLRIRKLITLKKSGPTVRRLGRGESVDLNDNLSDTDALQLVGQLRQSLRKSSWLKQPQVVRLYPFRNRTSKTIPERFFTLILERELISSPRVRLLGRRDEMVLVRKEHERQVADGFILPGRTELASTHVVTGRILLFIDQLPSGKYIRYRLTAAAINVETDQKFWMGAGTVKKKAADTDSPSW